MEINNNLVQSEVADMVLQKSDPKAAEKIAEEAKLNEVKGYDLNNGIDYEKILAGYMNTGFQATAFGEAVVEINRMVIRLLFKICSSKVEVLCVYFPDFLF